MSVFNEFLDLFFFCFEEPSMMSTGYRSRTIRFVSTPTGESNARCRFGALRLPSRQ
jgi:hypothetical protein